MQGHRDGPWTWDPSHTVLLCSTRIPESHLPSVKRKAGLFLESVPSPAASSLGLTGSVYIWSSHPVLGRSGDLNEVIHANNLRSAGHTGSQSGYHCREVHFLTWGQSPTAQKKVHGHWTQGHFPTWETQNVRRRPRSG